MIKLISSLLSFKKSRKGNKKIIIDKKKYFIFFELLIKSELAIIMNI
jgi:hypothetical protein